MALLGRILAQRRKNGRIDLESVETVFRTALHQAGAAALSELLQGEAPLPISVGCRVLAGTMRNITACAPNPSLPVWSKNQATRR
jgi:hypothetical protein